MGHGRAGSDPAQSVSRALRSLQNGLKIGKAHVLVPALLSEGMWMRTVNLA